MTSICHKFTFDIIVLPAGAYIYDGKVCIPYARCSKFDTAFELDQRLLPNDRNTLKKDGIFYENKNNNYASFAFQYLIYICF